MVNKIKYTPTKTTQFFHKLNKIIYLFGLPNFWVEDLGFSNYFKKIYDKLTKIIDAGVYLFILFECGALFTQKNLSNKQSSDLQCNLIAHAIISSYKFRLIYHHKIVSHIMNVLCIQLKDVYNDLEIEKKMIRKAKLYTTAEITNWAMCIISYTVEACVLIIKTGATFTTIITAWPDVDDHSISADILRSFWYIMWWLLATRVFGVYGVVSSLTVCLSHQYTNLQSYFQNLNNIFYKKDSSQREKENEYEKAYKIGIKMHSETLGCIDKIQVVCKDVFSGQIILNLILLILLMCKWMNTDRTMANIITIGLTSTAVLISTGVFMWSAGDITVEAAALPLAMYSSGWQNCHGKSSVRIRKLIVISMNQAQIPVTLNGLGVIQLSYQSYVSMCKSAYSIFSVLY